MKKKAVSGFSDSQFLELSAITKIGTWSWDLKTKRVIYSAEWAKILGYDFEKFEQNIVTWEKLVIPEDLKYANNQIERHLSGETPVYEAEFRMICKDGRIIWCQGKGKVIEFDENGNPVLFVGIIQDVTRLKNAEIKLQNSQETLNMAIKATSLGIWDWNISRDYIEYNNEFLNMLGYKRSNINGSLEEWKSMINPDDLENSIEKLEAYLSGKAPSYETEVRMKHKNGHFIWTRNVGNIVERDSDGNPKRVIGGHLYIDDLKTSQENLTIALKELQASKDFLELEVQKRTKDLVKQDKMLWNVNEIAKMLLTYEENRSFDDLILDCLRAIGEMTGQNRVYIWKNMYDTKNNTCCGIQVYGWTEEDISTQENATHECILYDLLPSFANALNEGKCLNSFTRNLSKSEIEIMEPRGTKTILIAPINIGGNIWGFIGIDNCDSEKYFSELEENMLLMSGFLIANAIQKRTDEEKMREAEERVNIMLNATPLCCNLWDVRHNCIACNDEALRLFGLSSREEYLSRFYELSPEYQPCGKKSKEMVDQYISKAFIEGYYRLEWMHQKINGEPIPSEITLVRVKYKNEFIVAGYIRDLREQKAMLAKINKTQEELASARDEAIANSKAKSEFLAKMSHEIRTPMNAIVGMSELILKDNITSTTKDRVYSIKHASANLLSIINDILDFSKIESGKLEIVKVKYSLASLVNDVVNIIQIRLIDKPIYFAVNIDSKLPSFLIGDGIRLRQIILNLLSNAVKYTKEGYVKFTITEKFKNEDTVFLKIEISDTGIGIKDKDITGVFEEFMQVDLLKNKGVEGTGLGLAITKNLCLLMNGTISVSSVYGEGSTFTVEIPQNYSEYDRFATVSMSDEKDVLIYESREVYAASLKHELENLNVRCRVVSNQSVFYDVIKNYDYSFIFIPAVLMESIANLVENLGVASKLVLLAEKGEEFITGKFKYLLLPAYSLSIANVLNDVCEESDYIENSSKFQFIAPRAKILVVDDINTNLLVAEGLMQPFQMQIDTCESGIEAIELVQKNSYDIVFMDHMMPVMDGIEATLAIREKPEFQDLPIIALTANAISGVKEMFLSNGFNDFIAKPIEIAKLNEILDKWIPDEKKERAFEKEITLAKPTFQIDGIDVDLGLSMIGGSIEIYLEVLTVFYNDGAKKISELKACIENKDISLFTIHVHALKSALASLGANELSNSAKALELAGKTEDVEYIKENSSFFLQELQTLLTNISYVINTSNATSNLDISQDNLITKLSELKTALEEMDAITTNEIVNELQKSFGNNHLAGKIEQISHHILLCEYDEAVNIINELI